MTVMIGVDPHKASHTAVAVSAKPRRNSPASWSVRAPPKSTRLLLWAKPFKERPGAIESAGGLGYLISQQLVAAGEEVLDVPATLASRVRVLGTGRSNKNDPNDALSVAVAALRSRDLRRVVPVGHSEILRLLAKRNTDIGAQRTRVVCRLHALLAELEADMRGNGRARNVWFSSFIATCLIASPSVTSSGGWWDTWPKGASLFVCKP